MCLLFAYAGAQAQNFGRISRVHPITEKRTYTSMEAVQPAVATYQPIRMRSTSLYDQNAPSTPSASGTVTPPRPHAGIRTTYHPSDPVDGEGNYWDDEEEAWLPIPGGGESHYYGERKEEGGVWYTWNGSEWVTDITMPTEFTPVGDMPWWLVLVLAAGYMVVIKSKKQKKNTMNTRSMRAMVVALLGIFVMGVSEAYAGGTAYSRARAYLKEGSPTAAGKVYVGGGAKSTSPGTYANCTSSTTPAATDQKEGANVTTTYHFWAQANAGYKFTGWYSKNASNVYSLVSSEAHYSVGVNSGAAPSSDKSYVDKDLYAEFIKLVNLSFIVPTNGSYTITHKGAAVANYASFTVDGAVVLNATPEAGYKLRGWYTSTDGGKTKKYFAFENRIEPKLTANSTIGAEFVPDDGKATFWPKGSSSVYDDLQAAINATGDGGTCVVVSDGNLAAGSYTIPTGKTLLIPHSSENSLMTEPKVVHVTAASSAPALSAYRTLRLQPGVSITVKGKLCVAGQIASVNGGNRSSFPCGPSGVLDLSQGGEITLNSGSYLYAWGFVKGQNEDEGNNTTDVGHITAKSGATVWEVYQVGDFRGGTASSSIYSSRGSWKFFPFQSWTIQNIEAPITFQSGANGKCFWTIFGDGKINSVDFTYVATSNALFHLGTGATMTKWYDATTDRVCYKLGGGASTLNAISLEVMGYKFSTSDFNLPVPCNMQIILESGTLAMGNPVVMHAGAKMEIQSVATLNLNSYLYLFDQSDWGKYCMYRDGNDVYFQTFNTMTKHYNRGSLTDKSRLEDATIVVNGTLNVNSSGKLYATAGGSQVRGNGGGTVYFATAAPAATTMTMLTNLKNTNSVNIAGANLLNENDTYTKHTAAATYYENVNGRWFIRSAKDPVDDHTWDFTYISSGAVNGTTGKDTEVSSVYSNDKTGTSDRMKWFDVVEDGCADWWRGSGSAPLSTYYYNYTLHDAWHQYIPTDEAGIYSGSDNALHRKDGCTWDAPDYPFEDCLYTIGGVQKALVGGDLIAVTANDPDDHAWHDASSNYYICLSGCNWRAATKTTKTGDVGTYDQAYTTTTESKKYIWYESAWLEATEEAPFFCARINNKLKYFEFVNGAWTIMEPVAEVTKKGTTAEYIRFSDVMNAIDSATANTTVRLLKDITLTSKVTYSNNKQVTFNLNGFTLSGGVHELITINNASAIFIVNDGVGTGKIDMTFSKSDDRSTAINVEAGQLILNGGNIHAENTHASQPTTAIELADGTTFTQNGGRVEAISAGETWGIYMAGTTSAVTINGGVDSVYTSAADSKAHAIYSGSGTVNLKGGKVIACADKASSAGGAVAVYLHDNSSRLTMSGGVARAEGNRYARTIYCDRNSAQAVFNGGRVEAETTGSSSYALRPGGGLFTVNNGATIISRASGSAYAIYTSGSSKLWVNGGRIEATTSSSTKAYGIYASAGTDTINGGEFHVTAKTDNAYGIYVASTGSGTRSAVVNGGKFMIKNSNGTATTNAYCNNTEHTANDVTTPVPTSELSIKGGYWNINTNMADYKAAEKNIVATTAADGVDIYPEYGWKVVAAEHTVTFKHSKTDEILQSKLVESGKVPVYMGETLADYSASTSDDTYEFIGWSTTKDGSPAPIAAVGSSDVTYWAVFRKVLAEVTIAATTTRYYESDGVPAVWTAALGATESFVKVLSNADDLAPLSTWKIQTATLVTLDMNGRHWGMDGTNDGTCFITVNKTDAKLIITDNSEDGEGYIHMGWTKDWAKAATITCMTISKGEVILEGGSIKCRNTADKITRGVSVEASGTFSMTGGSIDVYRTTGTTDYVCGVICSGTADLVAGTIKATHSAGNARAIYGSGTITLGENLQAEVNAYQLAYLLYGSGSFEVSGGLYQSTSVAGGAYGVRTSGANRIHISGNPKFTVVSKSSESSESSGAYGIFLGATGATIEIDSATFTVRTPNGGNAYGIYSTTTGVVTVHKATIDVNSHGNYAAIVRVKSGAPKVTIEDGTFTAATDTVPDTERTYIYIMHSQSTDTIHIKGGTYTLSNNGKSVSTCYLIYASGTGGKIQLEGNPTFEGNLRGIYAKKPVTIDGGEYICNSNGLYAVSATGVITVEDGKFKASSTPFRISDGSLRIQGGYYNADPSTYVVGEREIETGDFGNGYTHHVVNKHTVTWKDAVSNTNLIDPTLVAHNAFATFEGTPSHIDGSDTYIFMGWTKDRTGENPYDSLPLIKQDTVIYAQFAKMEAEVTEGDETTGEYFETFEEALEYAQKFPRTTIKLLSDVSLTTQISLDSAVYTTLDLNNHTLAYAGTAAGFLTLNNADGTFAITDNSEEEEGILKYDGTYTGSFYFITSRQGELVIQGGKIYARSTDSGASSDVYGVRVQNYEGAAFTMTGGTIDVVKEDGGSANGIISYKSTEITGGTIRVTASGASTGVRAVYVRDGSSTHIGGNAYLYAAGPATTYAIYIADANARCDITGGRVVAEPVGGGTQYGIYVNSGGTCNFSGGRLTFGSDTNGRAIGTGTSGTVVVSDSAYVAAERIFHCGVSSTATITVNGGTFEASSYFIRASGSGYTININGGKIKATEKIIHGEGATLTINGGYFNEKSGTTYYDLISSKINAETHEIWGVVEGTTEYDAGYRYMVLSKSVVAKVTYNGVEVLKESLQDAFEEAEQHNHATITLLRDVPAQAVNLTFSPAEADTCTLNLNGHKIVYAGMVSPFMEISKAGSQLIITGGATDSIKYKGAYDGNFYLLRIKHGELVLNGGVCYAENTNVSTGSVYGIYVRNYGDARLSMHGGTITSKRTNGNTAYGIITYGKTTITGGKINAISSGNSAYGVNISNDTTTISGVHVYSEVAAGSTRTVAIGGENTYCVITGGKYDAMQIADAETRASIYSVWCNNKCAISGGRFTVTNNSADGTGSCFYPTSGGIITISDSVSAVAPRIATFGAGNTLTINGGTFTCTQYVAKFDGEGSLMTINGGKYTFTRYLSGGTYSDSLKVNGGYWNRNNNLDTYCSAPKHPAVLTSAEKAIVGEDYNYKVTEAYMLTWTTNGDELSGDYTSGYTEPGTTIVPPATPTRTGYLFDGWSPTLAATMPSTDTDYTATWTVDSEADVEASVSVGDETDYYETLAEAFEEAKTHDGAVITLLKDVEQSEKLSFSPTSALTNTLDLNGHNLVYTGTEQYFLYISKADSKFIITGGATDTIKYKSSYNSTLRGLYVNKGELELRGGVIYAENTTTESSKSVNGVYVSANGTLTMSGGQVSAYAPTSNTSTIATGVYISGGVARVDGGLILSKATTSDSRAIILSSGGTLTIDGDPEIAAETYTSGATRVISVTGGTTIISGNPTFRGGYMIITNSGDSNPGEVTINGGTFTGTTLLYQRTSDAAFSFVANGGKFNCSSEVIRTDKTGGTVSFTGGYYSNNNTPLASYVTANHTLVALTAAEKAVIGSDYNWQVLEQYSASDKLDIVDYSATSVTLNMNGYTSAASQANWKIKAYDVTYDKYNRATDRTMEVSIPSSIHADDTIRMDGTSADDVVESRYVYIMPHIFTSDATLDPETVRATSILYVKSGTLTIDANTRVNKVYVCADAKLKINEGVTLTVDTVVLRTKPFHAAELENNGTLSVNGQMYYSRAIADKTAYHEIALPYDVNLTNMRFSNGKAATFGTYFSLMKYDGQSRADNGANVNLNWKPLNPAEVNTMSGNNAYQMLSSSAYYYEFYFPVTYVKKDDGAEVAVTAYTKQTQGPKIAGNEGWNFITSPYTHTFEAHYADPANGIKIAWRNESDIETFTQDVATTIQPTTAFFYQTETTGSLVFSSENFIFRAPGRGGMLQTQWLRLHYGADDEPVMGDIANIFLNDDRFSTAYETGYDVVKWSTEAAHPLVWSSIGGYDLAFAALPDSVATERMIPITVYNPQGDEYVFSLEENEYLSRLSEIYLYDAQENSYTDLKRDHYYCIAEEGLITGRFFIRTVKEAEEVATGIGTGFDNADKSPRKVLIDQHIYILMPDGKMYDVSGKRCSMKE